MIAFLPSLIASVKEFTQTVNIKFANLKHLYFRNEFIYASSVETRAY